MQHRRPLGATRSGLAIEVKRNQVPPRSLGTSDPRDRISHRNLQGADSEAGGMLRRFLSVVLLTLPRSRYGELGYSMCKEAP